MPPQVVREVGLQALRRTCSATPRNEAIPATEAEVEQGWLRPGILIAWGRVEHPLS
jgi:hypothetical protein